MTTFRIACWMAAAALAAAGCASNRNCRITVGNLNDAAVTGVTVKNQGQTLYQVASVAPKSRAVVRDVREDLSDSFTVEWQSPGSGLQTRTAKTKGPVPRSFQGTVYFQIGPSDVKAFLLPDSNEWGSDMPWAKPEAWEGFPAIPGLTQE